MSLTVKNDWHWLTPDWVENAGIIGIVGSVPSLIMGFAAVLGDVTPVFFLGFVWVALTLLLFVFGAGNRPAYLTGRQKDIYERYYSFPDELKREVGPIDIDDILAWSGDDLMAVDNKLYAVHNAYNKRQQAIKSKDASALIENLDNVEAALTSGTDKVKELC